MRIASCRGSRARCERFRQSWRTPCSRGPVRRFRPALNVMPRCRTMIEPAVTNWPSPRFMPSRWPTLSRPFFELEPASCEPFLIRPSWSERAAWVPRPHERRRRQVRRSCRLGAALSALREPHSWPWHPSRKRSEPPLRPERLPQRERPWSCPSRSCRRSLARRSLARRSLALGLGFRSTSGFLLGLELRGEHCVLSGLAGSGLRDLRLRGLGGLGASAASSAALLEPQAHVRDLEDGQLWRCPFLTRLRALGRYLNEIVLTPRS